LFGGGGGFFETGLFIGDIGVLFLGLNWKVHVSLLITVFQKVRFLQQSC